MLAIITRPMVVATDAGTAKQFVPQKDEEGADVPQEVSESEFGRLRRAGAAARFIRLTEEEIDAMVDEMTSHPDFPKPIVEEPVSKAKPATKGRKPKG